MMFPIPMLGALNGSFAHGTDNLERTFPPQPDSAPAARRFVLAVEWSEDEETNLRLSTLVSEVVTNAILHARTPFNVKITHGQQTIRVSVSDGSIAEPIKRTYQPTQPTGRGLHIVEAMADRWGVSTHTSGKTIWFELDRIPASA